TAELHDCQARPLLTRAPITQFGSREMAIKPRVKCGTSGDDTLDGTDQGETSFEFDGNNANTAGGGNDHAFGGRGKDVLVGGPGNDIFLIRQGTGVSEFSGTAQPESDDPVRGDEHRVGDEHEAKRAPSHIVVVIEENHDADQIVGNPNAPYINVTLIKDGLYYSNAHGTDHPSQPNYLELFPAPTPAFRALTRPFSSTTQRERSRHLLHKTHSPTATTLIPVSLSLCRIWGPSCWRQERVSQVIQRIYPPRVSPVYPTESTGYLPE